MGKNQHSKDRLFITATEWAHEYGGKKRERSKSKRQLPFDSCALSLQPFENPICTKDGVIFDVLHIMPFLQKHKVNPVDGRPMKLKDLVRLTMSKNSEGKWHCPVTYKVFNDNSRIVCVAPTGQVYSWDAVNELNVKAKNWKDLMTDAPFKREELIMLQDPDDEALNARRDISNFEYLKTMRDESAAAAAATPASQNIRAAPGTAKLFKEIQGNREQKRTEAKAQALEAAAAVELELDSIPDLATIRKLRPTLGDVNPGAKQNAAAASQSFTSSNVAVATATEMRLASVDEIREARWRCCRKIGKKGYVQLQTTLGNLNLEVHSDFVPMTAENFLGLCAKGAYDGTPLHRLIPGFMVQGGDTTQGDGTGGNSLWGGPFRDEFDSRLVHGGRGVVSMANAGKNCNKSQFFMCFRAARHLDNAHAVFGKVVGGMAVLDRIEQAARDGKTDRPKLDLRIIKATVFSDPIEEATKMLEQLVRDQQDLRQTALSKRTLATGGAAADAPATEKHRIAALEAADRKGWHSKPQPAKTSSLAAGPQAAVSGVGKYLGSGGSASTTLAKTADASVSASSSSSSVGSGGEGVAVDFASEPVERAPKKARPTATTFGDFSSW